MLCLVVVCLHQLSCFGFVWYIICDTMFNLFFSERQYLDMAIGNLQLLQEVRSIWMWGDKHRTFGKLVLLNYVFCSVLTYLLLVHNPWGSLAVAYHLLLVGISQAVGLPSFSWQCSGGSRGGSMGIVMCILVFYVVVQWINAAICHLSWSIKEWINRIIQNWESSKIG